MKTISVCLIVKNEERVLARCLECVDKFADEIIIVDTGSVDKTEEIAKKYTDKVYDFTWTGNFSDARNFSFSKATKDYIMWLDADDYISPNNITKILKLKAQPTDTHVFMLKYVMKDKSGNTTLEFFRERILKNRCGFTWHGFVHEVITPKGKIEYLDIEIEHRKINAGNPKRNLNLYNIAKKNGIKFSAREQYYYARELYYNNYFYSSEKAFKKYLSLNNKYPPDITGAYLMLTKIYISRSSFERAKNILFDYLKKYSPTHEIINTLAYLYDIEGDITNAIFYYSASLNCEIQQLGFINPDEFAFIPHVELSRLYYKQGNFDLAKYHHNQAKKIKSNHPSIIYNNQFFK